MVLRLRFLVVSARVFVDCFICQVNQLTVTFFFTFHLNCKTEYWICKIATILKVLSNFSTKTNQACQKTNHVGDIYFFNFFFSKFCGQEDLNFIYSHPRKQRKRGFILYRSSSVILKHLCINNKDLQKHTWGE